MINKVLHFKTFDEEKPVDGDNVLLLMKDGSIREAIYYHFSQIDIQVLLDPYEEYNETDFDDVKGWCLNYGR